MNSRADRPPHARSVTDRQQVYWYALAVSILLLGGCASASSVPASPSPLVVSPSPARVPELSPLPQGALPSLPAPTPVPSGLARTLPASLRGAEWTRVPTSRRVVALTFDGGSGAEGLPSILDTLAREKAPATFFLTGRWIATYPALARRIASTSGHSIGNHTMDHPDLTALSDDQVREEVAGGDRWIREGTGRSVRPLFRFPYGAVNPHVLGVVNDLGWGGVRWTVDTLGWKGTAGGQSVDSAYGRAVGAAEPGEIVLMHLGASPDGSTLDADALPRVITELRRRGYAFVSLGDFV